MFSQLPLKLPQAMYIPIERALPAKSSLQAWLTGKTSGNAGFSLDAAGLVALADLTTIARRTALTGTSCLADALVLCPGLHRQQAAPDLNNGEFPACAAMTTGYVFRVENPATVVFLQKVGRTGQLTTCWSTLASSAAGFTLMVPSLPYLFASFLTVAVLVLLGITQDWWGLSVILVLMFARLCNVLVIRRRVESAGHWKGASEPGVQGDLIVLLSGDRWVRIKGTADDLKAVTSGQWMSEPSFFESVVSAIATVLVYLDAALASNTTVLGSILLLVLLISSAGLLAVTNEWTDVLQMHGRMLEVMGERVSYNRRLDMSSDLIKQSGRKDWAVRLGMIIDGESTKDKPECAGVTM
ncbi:hypothetical protein MBLNU459_g3569t2 [Dothideomycetes sp. NU459]